MFGDPASNYISDTIASLKSHEMIIKVLDNLKVKLNTRGVAFTHLHSDNEFASRQLADRCMKNEITHTFSCTSLPVAD